MNENKGLYSKIILEKLAIEVYEIINMCRADGHKFPSNKKIAYMLREKHGIELSRAQVSRVRKGIYPLTYRIKCINIKYVR